MISQDAIASVIDAQNSEIEKKEEGLLREIIWNAEQLADCAT